MKKIEIEKATVEELRTFATVVLGLEVDGRATRDSILGKMAAAGYGVAHITLPEAAPEGPPEHRAGRAFNTRPAKDGGKEIRIRLHTQEKPGGDQPVPVGVNGSMILVPRGEDIWLHEKFVKVLENAVEEVYQEYSDDGGLGGLNEPRRVPSYPFSYV